MQTDCGLGPRLLAAAVGWLVRHRTSQAVRCWRRGGGARRIAGELSVRTLGDGDRDRVLILLHGLTASGDFFGARYDTLADHAQLVIPDLLGFGRSLDENRVGYCLQAHLAALDAMARELQIDGRALTIAGHSFTRSALCSHCAGPHAAVMSNASSASRRRCTSTQERQGYIAVGAATVGDADGETRLGAGQWFCMPDGCRVGELDDGTRVVVSQKVGFTGLRAFGGPIERLGRLRYIDRCSDTLLAPPPMCGDACLNHLHFPVGIEQTEHTIRPCAAA